MKIKLPIPVKMVVTLSSKQETLSEIESKMSQIHKEIEQLQFQQKKLYVEAKKKGMDAINKVQDRIDFEFNRRQEKLEVLTEQWKLWENIIEGDEILYSTVEAEVDIMVGVSWKGIQKKEIVIKDGIIIEIRGD